MKDNWRKAFLNALETTQVPPANAYNPHEYYAEQVMEKSMRALGIRRQKWRKFAALHNGTPRHRFRLATKIFRGELK